MVLNCVQWSFVHAKLHLEQGLFFNLCDWNLKKNSRFLYRILLNLPGKVRDCKQNVVCFWLNSAFSLLRNIFSVCFLLTLIRMAIKKCIAGGGLPCENPHTLAHSFWLSRSHIWLQASRNTQKHHHKQVDAIVLMEKFSKTPFLWWKPLPIYNFNIFFEE